MIRPFEGGRQSMVMVVEVYRGGGKGDGMC